MSTQTRFLLQNQQWERVKSHIDENPTLEVCGLLGGVWHPYDKIAIVHAITPIDNIDQHPQIRFTMHPKQLLNALLDYESNEWEMVGIYHSHPKGEPKPSETDIAEMTYPDAVYLIGVPYGELLAWRIKNDAAQKVVLEIV